MKASSFFLIALLLLAAANFGCKSNPAAPGSSISVITIIPSSFHGTEFVIDTFKARITNHDFAQTYFIWDMGDTTLISYSAPYSFEAIHFYSKPGKYKIVVKAYDFYSNLMIASDSTIATIDTAKSTVEIVPQFYTGTLTTNTFGILDPFSLSVKTSIPESDLYQFWDYGDGTTDSFKSGPQSHVFPRPGSYLLKVDLYQTSGIYVGSDTAAITISLPDISTALLNQTQQVECYLYIDSANLLYPYAARSMRSWEFPFTGDSVHKGTWNGNDFSVFVHDSTSSRIGLSGISGSLSSDRKSMRTMTLLVKDSMSPSNNYKFSFTGGNLRLAGVTSTDIIFTLSGDQLNVGLSNEIIYGISSIPEFGSTESWGNFFNNLNPIHGLILVFKH